MAPWGRHQPGATLGQRAAGADHRSQNTRRFLKPRLERRGWPSGSGSSKRPSPGGRPPCRSRAGTRFSPPGPGGCRCGRRGLFGFCRRRCAEAARHESYKPAPQAPENAAHGRRHATIQGAGRVGGGRAGGPVYVPGHARCAAPGLRRWRFLECGRLGLPGNWRSCYRPWLRSSPTGILRLSMRPAPAQPVPRLDRDDDDRPQRGCRMGDRGT